MIVIVESNFVLELALRQEESTEAVELVELAEAQKIRLVLPAYALVEPLHKLGRNRTLRIRLSQDLEQELIQMGRSTDFADVHKNSTSMMAALAKKSDVDDSTHRSVVQRLLNCAEVIPLTAEVLADAGARQLFDLGAQDSIVYSSVEHFVRGDGNKPSLFANKNSKDFMVQSVTSDLGKYECEVVTKFAIALARVESARRASGNPEAK